jgi:hypothetical protein
LAAWLIATSAKAVISERCAECGQRDTPSVGRQLQHDVLGKPVSRSVTLWDRVPRSVFDRDRS